MDTFDIIAKYNYNSNDPLVGNTELDGQAMAKGDLDTILLDEPTIHLDSFRRHELINLLKDMTVLPQMIIVTHESQLENAADNLIKVEKDNGISKVSS